MGSLSRKTLNRYNAVRKPLITEKSTICAAGDTYVFEVDKFATKELVKVGVERCFNVKVDKVRTLITKGRVKRTKGIEGVTRTKKKAYVSLKPGFKIELVSGV